ncbi:VWA domain-containing protein [Aestuariimicrobium ganziense]|uniref:VWA domain-containing protein n=1 Tax=Aestuariimicrobium ganziense TaxID=2773677 RepID=UPI001A9B8D51
MTALLVPMIEFLSPNRLWWLIAVAVVAVLYFALVTRTGFTSGRRAGSRLDLVIPKDKPWKRHLAVGAAVLAMAMLVVAYAKPKDFAEVPRERATVVLAIDVSISMKAEDVKPNRMRAAQDAAKEFTTLLPPRFNVGLVSFAGTARPMVPPTTDRGSVQRAIDALQYAPSTAIGEGVYQSLNLLKTLPPDPQNPNDVPPAAIVLLSDGATNMGRSSEAAAREAKKQGVPVYTIAYGTANGYVVDRGVRQAVPVNHNELAIVARESGGKKFSAASSQELKEVYQAIARSVGYERVYVEVTHRYVTYALLAGLVATLGVMSLAARWP